MKVLIRADRSGTARYGMRVKQLASLSSESPRGDALRRERAARRLLSEMRARRAERRHELEGAIEASYAEHAARAAGLEFDRAQFAREWASGRVGAGEASAPLGNSETSHREPLAALPRFRSEDRDRWWSAVELGQLHSEFARASAGRWRGASRLAVVDLQEDLTASEAVRALRTAARPVQLREDCAACGDRMVGMVGVAPMTTGGHAITGVVTCGSPWDCPVCAAKIRAKRAEEVLAAVDLHRRHTAADRLLVTLTIRHDSSHSLRELRDGFQSALALFRKRARRDDALREIFGMGDITGREVTHGDHGWHYHTHHLTFCDRRFSDDEISRLAFILRAEWSSACVAAGLDRSMIPDLEHGAHLARSVRADYVSKLGLEVSSSWGKKARGESRTPWDILRDAADGDGEALKLWWEHSRAMRGTPSVRVGRNLSAWLQRLGWKAPDESSAADEVCESLAVEIPVQAWRDLRAIPDARTLARALALPSLVQVVSELRRLTPSADWSGSPDWGEGGRVEYERAREYDAAERRAIRRVGGDTAERKKQDARTARIRFKRAHFREYPNFGNLS